jgi:hypothetical protein
MMLAALVASLRAELGTVTGDAGSGGRRRARVHQQCDFALLKEAT